MFEWKDEYETGVPHIDEQHKKLFDIGNDGYELLTNSFSIDKYDKILEIIGELGCVKNFVFPLSSTNDFIVS